MQRFCNYCVILMAMIAVSAGIAGCGAATSVGIRSTALSSAPANAQASTQGLFQVGEANRVAPAKRGASRPLFAVRALPAGEASATSTVGTGN